jgi:hypothetical protein
VAGPNTCQTMCDVSRGINDRDRPSEGQVSEIKALSAYRTSGNRGSGIQEACACDTENAETPMSCLTEVMC